MYRTSRAWDPLYGAIRLSEFEVELVHLPEVQRLRYVRMCNINSLLVTGASEISRFEHCLGVLYLAKVWADAHHLTDQDKKDLCTAALFHDLQTGPFGHSFQYILEDNRVHGGFLHDDITHGYKNHYHQEFWVKSSFAGSPFEAHKKLLNRWEYIGELIKGKGTLGPLISGAVDLDNIDNVFRLAYHAGVATKEDAQIAIQLVQDMEPFGEELRLSVNSLEFVSRWQAVRRRLYELLLLDWAEFSAKGMLTRALELAIDASLIEPQHWLLTDDELLRHLEDNATGEHQEVRDLVRRVRLGDLFVPLLLNRSRRTDLYQSLARVETKRKLERDLQKTLRKSLGYSTPLFIHFILDKRKTDRSVRVRIRETGDVQDLGRDTNDLLVGVFLSTLPPRAATQDASVEARAVLRAYGLEDLKNIDDPMASAETVVEGSQLNLL